MLERLVVVGLDQVNPPQPDSSADAMGHRTVGLEDLEGARHRVYRALVVGTRDYVRKCGFSEAIVSLSGGIDSALVGAIAVDALGPAQVRGVALPSRYSSEGSLADARELDLPWTHIATGDQTGQKRNPHRSMEQA